MDALTPTARRALRARAHALKPVVFVGQHGLTPAVLHEIDVALTAHALVKIRVFSDERGERDALLQRICAELDADAVQHLGKVLTLWRPKPPPEPAAKEPRKERGAKPSAKNPRTSTDAVSPINVARRARGP